MEEFMAKYGNRTRYNIQKKNFNLSSIEEDKLLSLIETIHKYKKGLDQEIFIKEKLRSS